MNAADRTFRLANKGSLVYTFLEAMAERGFACERTEGYAHKQASKRGQACGQASSTKRHSRQAMWSQHASQRRPTGASQPTRQRRSWGRAMVSNHRAGVCKWAYERANLVEMESANEPTSVPAWASTPAIKHAGGQASKPSNKSTRPGDQATKRASKLVQASHPTSQQAGASKRANKRASQLWQASGPASVHASKQETKDARQQASQ